MKTIIAFLSVIGVVAMIAGEPALQPAVKSGARPAESVAAAPVVQNPAIDYDRFQKVAAEVEPVREKRRLTETEFVAMARQPGTVVLDARSADKFAMRHITGAVNLPFTEFTAAALAKVLPAKDTRVLIYCNNNFQGARVSMEAKVAVVRIKGPLAQGGQAQELQAQVQQPERIQQQADRLNGAASLNISTYIALATYGYTNVYELGPLLEVSATALPFEGTEIKPTPTAKR